MTPAFPTWAQHFENRQRIARGRIEQRPSTDGTGRIVHAALEITPQGAKRLISEHDTMSDAADVIGLEPEYYEPYDRVEYETAEQWERHHKWRDGYEFLAARFAEITGEGNG